MCQNRQIILPFGQKSGLFLLFVRDCRVCPIHSCRNSAESLAREGKSYYLCIVERKQRPPGDRNETKSTRNKLPYARKATAEKLVGDRYILTVTPATVAEILGNKKVTLNTSVYVNPDAEGGQTRASISMPGYAAKYTASRRRP